MANEHLQFWLKMLALKTSLDALMRDSPVAHILHLSALRNEDARIQLEKMLKWPSNAGTPRPSASASPSPNISRTDGRTPSLPV